MAPFQLGKIIRMSFRKICAQIAANQHKQVVYAPSAVYTFMSKLIPLVYIGKFFLEFKFDFIWVKISGEIPLTEKEITKIT